MDRNKPNRHSVVEAWFDAAEWGDTRLIECLIKYDSNFVNLMNNDSGNKTALMYAANHGYVEMAKLLMENGADLNLKRNKDCASAYVYAIRTGEEGGRDIAVMMIEKTRNIKILHELFEYVDDDDDDDDFILEKLMEKAVMEYENDDIRMNYINKRWQTNICIWQ